MVWPSTNRWRRVKNFVLWRHVWVLHINEYNWSISKVVRAHYCVQAGQNQFSHCLLLVRKLFPSVCTVHVYSTHSNSIKERLAAGLARALKLIFSPVIRKPVRHRLSSLLSDREKQGDKWKNKYLFIYRFLNTSWLFPDGIVTRL
jgi:hypothetical protein